MNLTNLKIKNFLYLLIHIKAVNESLKSKSFWSRNCTRSEYLVELSIGNRIIDSNLFVHRCMTLWSICAICPWTAKTTSSSDPLQTQLGRQTRDPNSQCLPISLTTTTAVLVWTVVPLLPKTICRILWTNQIRVCLSQIRRSRTWWMLGGVRSFLDRSSKRNNWTRQAILSSEWTGRAYLYTNIFWWQGNFHYYNFPSY